VFVIKTASARNETHTRKNALQKPGLDAEYIYFALWC
jgi:hypothetical protein